MATYSDKWYILTTNTSSGAVTGIVTESSVVKEFTSEASALTYIQDNYGEDEVILVQKQDITFSVTAA